MRNAGDTPADGFTRVAGVPGASGTPEVPVTPGHAPLPRRRPGANRPDWTAPGEAEALASAEALRYAAQARGAPWGPAPQPPRPAEPRSGGPRPAPAPPAEAAPRGRGPRPAPARSGELAPRSPGLRPPVSAPVAVPGRAPSRAPVPPPSRGRAAAALAQVPYLVVVACTAGGIVWAWRGSHDVGNGAGVVGGALLAAAVARLVLPQSAAGLLASRRRFADVLALGALGAGLLVLALVLPPT